MRFKNKKEVEKEMLRLAAIQKKFQDIGQHLYLCWKDDKPHNFELIMQEFERDLNELNKTGGTK